MVSDATARPRVHLYGDDYAPYYLNHINNRLSSGASQLYLRHFGIGLNEFRILSVLANKPDCHAGHVCATLGIHKAVVSRSLAVLESKGLVAIDSSRRLRRLRLTPSGDQMHDDIVVIALGREQRLLAGFNESERRVLFGLLQRMLDNMPSVNAWDPFDEG